MAYDNTVTVVGNVTRDPELRFTPSGAAVATFGLAWNRRSQNARGEMEEQVSFFDVTCWRQLAENVAESLTRGMRVIVQGRLRQRSYETREGEKRTVIELEVDEIGPSLRYATAQVRRTGSPGAGGSQGGAAPTTGTAGGAWPGTTQDDEPPF